MFNRIGKFLTQIYQNAEGFLLCTFTLLMVADVMLGILARYVHFNVVFADELGKYFFVWLCTVGISAAVRDNQHIRLNFVVQRLPVNPRLTWVVSQLLFLFFTLFFFYWGLQLTIMHFVMNKSVMGFRFPMYVLTTALPVGLLRSFVRLVHDLYLALKYPDDHKP